MNILERISCHNFIEVDGYAYFSNWFYNGLFKVEIKTGKTFFLGFFEDEKLFEKNIHLDVMLKDEKIYFFPRRGRHIHVYQLSDGTMQAFEIRKKSEPFYVIEKTMLKENSIIFSTEQKNIPIKIWNQNTHKVTCVDNNLGFHGKCLSECNKNIFPLSMIEKYKLKYIDQVLMKQTCDGKWYTFTPLSRQLLFYSEEDHNLKIVPLHLVNEEEFQKHLDKVKQDFFKTGIFSEINVFRPQELVDIIVSSDKVMEKYNKVGNKHSIGEEIWKVTAKLIE